MQAVRPKDWLGTETERNRNNADLYTAIMRRAYGDDESVLIGHHLCFQQGHDINTENEIPAADSLIFDVEIMVAVFGEAEAYPLLRELAILSPGQRDRRLKQAYSARYGAPPVCD